MREFDDIIRRKLEQLPVEGTPDWTALQERLEGDAFDALLRDQLAAKTSLSGADKVPPAVMGWEALSSKLDVAAEVEGDVFDRILSQKLSNANTTLEPEDSWKVLSHRMDTLWPLRKVLARYRVMEMAAALALLLTFAPILRDNPILDRSGSGSVTSTSSTSELLPQQNALLSSDAGDDLFLQPEEIATLVYASDDQTARNSTATNISANDQASAARSTVTNSRNASPIYSPFALLKGMVDWFTGPTAPNATAKTYAASDFDQPQFSQGIYSASSVPVSAAASSSLTEQAELNLSAIDRLMLDPLGMTKTAIPAIAIPTVKASKWQVGPQATYQAWNIRTPVDMEFEQQAFSRWQGGAAFGLSAIRTLSKRASLGIGASLSLLRYDPDLPTVFDAADINSLAAFDRTESFDGISINLAQVPVDFRIRLTKPGKRAKLTAFAGFAGNFTLSSDYDRSLLLGVPVEPASGPVSEVEEVFPDPVPVERTFSDAKEFLPGVLEGGTLVGNTFLSGRLGLESSFAFNDRISAFSSLSYSHFLPLAGGFGPNKDKLSAVGFSIGTRVNL